MKLSKKDIRMLILYTIVLIFGFIYIKEIWGFIKYILNIFSPFIIGLMIAFVLNCLMCSIENKWFKNFKWSKSFKRGVSLSVALLIVLLLFVLLLLIIIPNLQETFKIFAGNMPDYINNLRSILIKFNISDNIINEITNSLKVLADSASSYIVDNSDKIIETSFGIATNLVTGIINIFIGVIFAIYYLASKEDLHRKFNMLIKAYLPKKALKIKKVTDLSNKVFSNFVSGQCLEAIIIGILCFIGMLILRLPYAATISIIVGFTALIPVFGAFIGTILGAFLILMINPLQALIFITFILVLQQLEGNLIYPHVVGKSVGLPGIWVLVAVTVGASINGVLGMLLSVPIVSILYSLLKTDLLERFKNTSK